MTHTTATHIQVASAKGTTHLGIQDGQLLAVTKETNCFFFVETHAGRGLKVSKHTKRLCHWGNANTSAVFNI
jgi:hypothetical protein